MRRCIAFVAVFVFIVCGLATTATIHVPADQPTIQAGIDAAVDGDTVLVAPGQYVSNIVVDGKGIILLSESGASVTTLRPASTTSPLIKYVNNASKVNVVEGFTLTGVTRFTCIDIWDGYIYVLNNVFLDNYVTGSQSGAVLVVADCTIRGNEFIRNHSANQGGALTVVSPNEAVIENNVFKWNYAVHGGALSVSYANNAVVRHNTFSGDTAHDYGGAIYVGGAERAKIYNNTIDSCVSMNSVGGGISMVYPTSNALEFDNIIVNCSGFGVFNLSFSDYDDCYQNVPNDYYQTVPGAHSISTDPLFVGGAPFDYHLQPTSPCIDAGDPNPIYNDPDGTRNDMGAFFGHANHPPVIAPLQNTIRLEGDTVSLLVTTTDPDSTIPTLSVQNLPANATFADSGNGTGSFYWPIAPNQYGVFDITFIASDSILADSETVTITVLPRLPEVGMIAVDRDTLPSHLLQHVPPIDWQYVDFNNDDPQLKFEVAVGTDSDWTYAEMWNPAPFNSSDTFVVYNGSPLVDGATYWLRLRVNNTLAWSEWKQISFRMNSIPSVPLILSPADGAVVSSQHPSLTIRNSIDADSAQGGGPYDPVVPTGVFASFGCTLVMLDGKPAPAQTSVDAFDPDGVHCGSQLVASGGLMPFMAVYGEEPWIPGDQGCELGDIVTFRVNGLTATVTDNATWTPFNVSILTSLSAWSTDTLYYLFEVSPDSFSSIIYSFEKKQDADTTTTLIIDSTLAENAKYYWRVKASDYYEESGWSETRSFYVNSVNSPPTAFALILPPDTAGVPVTTLLPRFDWETSYDADPLDSVKYAHFVAVDSNFTFVHQVSGLTTPTYTLNDSLAWGTRYWWKVKAYDLNGGVTWSNQVFTFRTVTLGDADNDAMVSLTDVVFLVNYIFVDGPAPEPLFAGDANCDGRLNISDAVYLVNYIFGDGEPPCDDF